jgi:hypothetical protein
MAAVAWLVSKFCGSLPLAGIALKLVRVSAAITLAAIAFMQPAGCYALKNWTRP